MTVLLYTIIALVRRSLVFELEKLDNMSPERESMPGRRRLPIEQDLYHRLNDGSRRQCQRDRYCPRRLARPYPIFLPARFLFVCPICLAILETL